MKALLKKDFLILYKCGLLVSMIGFTIFATGTAMTNHEDFYLFYIPFMGVVINFYASAPQRHDRASNWKEYRKALPFSENDVVNSRYVFSILIFLYSCIHSVVPYLGRYIVSIFNEELVFSANDIYRALAVAAVAAAARGIFTVLTFVFDNIWTEVALAVSCLITTVLAYIICTTDKISMNLGILAIFFIAAFIIFAICWKTSIMIQGRSNRNEGIIA